MTIEEIITELHRMVDDKGKEHQQFMRRLSVAQGMAVTEALFAL